jgi:hypothetical protein
MIEFVLFVRRYHVEHLTMAAVAAVFIVVALVDQARLRRRQGSTGRPAAAPHGAAAPSGVRKTAAARDGRIAGTARAYGSAAGHTARTTRLRHLAALLAVTAGAIHLLVAPEHFAEDIAPGAFMVAAGAAQIAAGVLLLLHPSRLVMVASVAGTLAILAVYAASRTTGLPVGPTPWVPERVGTIDIASKVTEVEFVAIVVLLMVLGGAPLPASDGYRSRARTAVGSIGIGSSGDDERIDHAGQRRLGHLAAVRVADHSVRVDNVEGGEAAHAVAPRADQVRVEELREAGVVPLGVRLDARRGHGTALVGRQWAGADADHA